MSTLRLRTVAACLIAAALVGPAAAEALRFSVTYDPKIAPSFTGRVYVMLGRGEREPRLGPRWFSNEPFFARDVKGWTPDQPLVFDDSALAFPGPVGATPPGDWSVQAVMRRNLDSPTIGRGPGTAYSEPLRRVLTPSAGTLDLRIDKVVEDRPLQESDRVKLAEIRSGLLSDFHGREVRLRASVILPPTYDLDPSRRYPALYWIGGFGSTHRVSPRELGNFDSSGRGDRIVRVVLDPSCYGGHHVFADSQNNGPWGTALVEELIPHLEKRFRLVAAPTARFLSGPSSGGWSSLWLQVAWPGFFGGVWSLAPDPIDFRDFQRIDLYAPGANMFTDEQGERRPIAREGARPFAWYDSFAAMEVVYGDGGQLRSFDWVFSPRGADGAPRRLFDPASGAVDPAVAESWKRYDIRLILQENWKTLGPRLAGRITIVAGELDTFYLEGAVRNVKEVLGSLGSDAVIEIVPGADHGSFATPALFRRIDQELLAKFDAAHPEATPAVAPREPEPAGVP